MARLDPLRLLVRCVAGFFAGFIMACFVLVFIGALPRHPHHVLSTTGIEQQSRSLWLAFYIACGVAVFVMIIGRIRLSKFWLWFVVAFGVTSIIPFWPYKPGSVSISLATLYLDLGFELFHLALLAGQIAVSLAVAALIHLALPWRSKRKAIQ